MLVLTPEEIRELTDKTHRKAQMRELTHMGIPFNLTTAGEIKVIRSHVIGGQDEEIYQETRGILSPSRRARSG